MKKLLLFLFLLLPVLLWGQGAKPTVYQAASAPSGAAFNQAWGQYANLDIKNTFSIPTGTNFTWNNAIHREASLFWRQSDSSLMVGHADGTATVVKGGGGTDAIYFKKEYFGGLGTSISPLAWNPTITFQNDQIFNLNTHNLILKNLPQGFNGDSIAVWHHGILSRAVDNPSASPNAILSGLNFSLVNDTTLSISPGVWRIDNVYYNNGITVTILPISVRDTVSIRYDAYYADTLGTIGRVQGVLSGTAIIPPVPDGTVYIGSVLITPTGPSLQPVNAYLPLNLTGTSTIVRGNENQFLRFSMTTGGTGSASFEVNGISSFYDFYTQAKTSSASSELFGDTTGFQMTNTNASNKSNIINIGAYSSSGKGISIQLDQDSLFTYQNTNYETRLRNYGLGTSIPDMNILRSIADSVKGTILPINIGNTDLTLTGERFLNTGANIFHIYSSGGGTVSNGVSFGTGGFQSLSFDSSFPSLEVNLNSSQSGGYFQLRDDVGNSSTMGIVVGGGGSPLFPEMSITKPGSIQTGLFLTTTTATFKDQISSKGLVYAGNYEANFTAKSLVDKRYVDSVSTATGTVTSVSGTTNRIDVTGTTTPVVNISSTFEALLGKVANPLSQFASTTSAQLAGVLSDESGTGVVAYTVNGVFTTPNLGTPSALVGTNITGTGSSFIAGNINGTTNGTLTTLSVLSLPYIQLTGVPTIPTAANPTASVGGSAVNGSAATFMRSDAAPKADTAILQTVLNFFPKGDTRYAKTSTNGAGANPTATAGSSAVNGSAITFMRSDAAPKIDSAVFATKALLSTYTPETRTVAGFPLNTNVTLGTLTLGRGLLGTSYNPSGNTTATLDTTRTLTFLNAENFQNILPRTTNAYTLGTSSFVWQKAWANALSSSSSSSLTLTTPGATGIFFQTNNTTVGEWFSGGHLVIGASPADDAVNLLQVGGSVAANSFTTTLTALGTTTSAVHTLANSTAAALNAQQITPALLYSTNGWGTAASTSQNVSTRLVMIPIQSTSPIASFLIQSSINGGAFNTHATFNSNGNANITGNFTAGVSIMNHIQGNTSAPTIAAGTGAGTSPTVAVTGNDIAEKVSITTGTSPTVSATVATITFNVSYATNAPKVIITPANAAAAALNGTAQIYIDDSTIAIGSYKILVGSAGLSASTAYLWYVQVIQ